jgi:hypothetical protein
MWFTRKRICFGIFEISIKNVDNRISSKIYFFSVYILFLQALKEYMHYENKLISL